MAVVVAAALTACGSGGGKKAASSTTTSAGAPTTFGAGAPRTPVTAAGGLPGANVPTSTPSAPDQQLSAFRAPSSNIGCELVATQVARCDIRDHAWSAPPKPSDCDLDWGFGLQVATTGQAGFVCAGDTANDPSSPVLGYGQRARQGSFVCASAETGVTCTNEATGRGFFVSRESYRIF